MSRLIGRGRLLADLASARAEASIHTVLLVGGAGVGKSRLLDAGAVGGDLRVWGMPALSTLPLGALGPLLPTSVGTAEEQAPVAMAVLGRATAALVDDLDRLDPLSRAVLDQARLRGLRLVATVRMDDDGSLPRSVRDLATSTGTRVLVVDPFGLEETQEFLADLLGGPPAATLVDDVWHRARGNALFTEQLVQQARLRGDLALTPAGWQATRPLGVPPRLEAILLERIDELDSRARELALLLAGVGRLDEAVVHRIDATDASADLFRVELVESFDLGGAEAVRFRHPLFAEVLWGRTRPRERRVLLSRFLQSAGDLLDPIRRTTLAVEAGQEVAPDDLIAAARLADESGDVRQALALVDAAVDGGADVAEAASVRAGALLELGDAAGAVAVLKDVLELVPPGLQAIQLALQLHDIELWTRFDVDAGTAALAAQAARIPQDEAWGREALAIAEANGLTYAGRAGSALAVLDALPDDPDRPAPFAALIATSRAHATTVLGRTAEAVEVATTAHEEAVGRAEAAIPGVRLAYLVIASHALCHHGKVEEALSYARRAHTDSVEAGVVRGRAWAALNVGSAWLHIGDLERSSAWARRALAAADEARMVDCRRIALENLVICAGAQGHCDEDLLEQLEAATGGIGFLIHQVPIARAWARHAAGQPAQATKILRRAGAAALADSAHMAAAWIAHERLRMEDPVGTVEVLEACPPGSPMLEGRLLLARGMVAQDPHLTARAAQLFADLGVWISAAESAAVTARWDPDATRWRTQARAWAGSIGSPRTPQLLDLADPGLTRREREIAVLAAAGASNTDIASRLTLSRRTVENHLARAYSKLGVSSRLELHAALRGSVRDAEPSSSPVE